MDSTAMVKLATRYEPRIVKETDPPGQVVASQDANSACKKSGLSSNGERL
ncbi:hypothetical protein PAAG_11138 [Paracoccidioides lutzii Pb01]|uniref:Uncharacterized protein n=1 Tax=Paracoccidioides lutzii (strain ATCC MYA-826 / Pb01) TaxID=502779 RepID=A0A0A2V7B4_PARBA|nr:hypothetical protein PAAG_11138 [Paracoccidioides lutzii Pb01]KGQ02182.1 hypothetical protein PAAG_11138 [Paracoccidioides lutzii Pb01]